ncbi:hypothetical protein [Leptospira interrogans]|uniref:hypothetical protein n=1 Tax=Leptospira interrogans TaxID=173 RepID=UPI00077317D5|nr:hypothetical protein [Leptospira interrogans]
MWGWLWLSNSASHSPRIVRQIAFGTQQNAFLWVAFGTQQNAFLWVAFGTQQNALYGSRLELSRTLSTDRVWNSAERSLRIAFGTQQNAFLWVAFGTQQNAFYGSRSRLKLKAKYRITFLSYNLLTEAENAAGFIQAFLL